MLTDSGMRRLLGSLVHTTDDPHYHWLNDRVCAVEGEVRPRADGSGFDVVLEVSEMVWEEVACAGAFPGDPVNPRQRALLQIAGRYIGNRFTEMPS